MRIFKSKRAAILGVVASLAVAAAAIAYWTSQGSGEGSAQTGTTAANDFSIVDQAFVGPSLVPGGPSATVNGAVQNNAANGASLAPQELVATIVDADDGTSSEDTDGCDSTDYEFVGNASWTVSGAGNDVATYNYPAHTNLNAGQKSAFPALTIRMVNKPSAIQDDCKESDVQIAYAIS